MSVKIMSGLPKGEHNGLAGMEDRIESAEGSLVPLVVLADISLLGHNPLTDETVVQLRIADVEIVDRDQANALLRAGRKDRTGSEELAGVDFDGGPDDGE